MPRQISKNHKLHSAFWRRSVFVLLFTGLGLSLNFSLVSANGELSAQSGKKLPLSQPVSAVQFHYLMKENAAADAAARQDAFPARSFERHSRRLQVMTSKNNTPYQRLA